MINRRNVCSDVKSAYRADRDFLSVVLKSRVIAAGMNVLGLENKTGKPSKFVLPPNIENLQKSKKLELLHELAAKVVDGFIFQDSSNLVDRILTAEEKQQLLQQQELIVEEEKPEKVDHVAPPLHKRFDPRLCWPDSHRTLLGQSNSQIVGSVVCYTLIFRGCGGAFDTTNITMLRNVFSNISGTTQPNNMKFEGEMQLR